MVRRIAVTVVPSARKPRVERVSEGHLRVAVSAPPHEGQANAAVLAALAEYFGVPGSRRIRIVRGKASRHKIVEIEQAEMPR